MTQVKLTARQAELARLAKEGLTNDEIAREMGISVDAVKRLRRKVSAKGTQLARHHERRQPVSSRRVSIA
jgi:DNA-binding CsgD family transcriptional regulator